MAPESEQRKKWTPQAVVSEQGVETTLKLDCRVFSLNLNDEVVLLLDGIAIPSDGMDLKGGETKTLTFDYINADVLIGFPLALDWIPDTDLVAGDLTSQPPLGEPSVTHRWNLKFATKTGTFKLKVFTDKEEGSLLTPTIRLRRDLPTLRFFRFFGAGDYPSPPEVFTISVGSIGSFNLRLHHVDGSPMAGVWITIYRPEIGSQRGRTSDDGIVYAGGHDYRTPGLRKLTALAETPVGNVRIALLLDVIP